MLPGPKLSTITANVPLIDAIKRIEQVINMARSLFCRNSCLLISDIITIDNLICSKFPNYKNCIADSVIGAYNRVSMIIHSGSIKVDDYSREKLGEDNYCKILEFKNSFIDQTNRDWNDFVFFIGEGYNKGKSKVKEWYYGFKGQ